MSAATWKCANCGAVSADSCIANGCAMCEREAPVAPIVGWMTEDGRIATDETKRTGMASTSKPNFNIALVRADAVAPAIQQEGAALSDEQIGEAVQRGYSKDDGIRMCYSDQQNVIKEVRTILAASQQPAAAPSVPDDALSISGWLRHFAGNGGYSHNDYADTMRQAADELDRAAAPAIQQEGAALDERAAFEVWCVRHGYSANKWSGDGSSYTTSHTASAWEAWQARAALTAPAPVQPGIERDAALLRAIGNLKVWASTSSTSAPTQYLIDRAEVIAAISAQQEPTT